MKHFTRTLSFLLALAMVLSLIPFSTMDAQAAVPGDITVGQYIIGKAQEADPCELDGKMMMSDADVKRSSDSMAKLDGASLKPGNYVQWIDRLNLSSHPQLLTFYNWLVANSSGNGALILGNENGSDTHLAICESRSMYVPSGYSLTQAKSYVRDAEDAWFDDAASCTFAVYGAFDRDHPEVFWINGNYWVSYGIRDFTLSGNYATYTLNMWWVLNDSDDGYNIRHPDYADASTIRNTIANRDKYTNEAIAYATGTTRFEIMRQLNYWLTHRNCYNTSYDLDAIYHDARECVSALEGRVGYRGPVCEAYARALKVICDKMGIPCVLVDGANHMWNNVQMEDGKWYVMDVTWNDPLDYSGGPVSGYENENYLLVGSNKVAGDHPVENAPSTNGFGFTNGPVLNYADYNRNTKVAAAIAKHPTNVSAVSTDTVTFTVKATGSDLKYQWQYRTGTNAGWVDAGATGNKTTTVTVPAAGKNGFQYRCKVTGSAGNTVYSNAATMTVLGIATQPTSKTAAVNSTAVFTVKANGTGLAYQWQYRTSATGGWANAIASGNKTASLSVPVTKSKDGYQYRCKVSDSAGKVLYTNIVTLKVGGPTITQQPVNTNSAVGAITHFTVKASGSSLTYQWQYRTSATGGWANALATGNKTATLSVPVTQSKNGYYYRCKITDSAGLTVYTNAVKLTVSGEIVTAVTTQPLNQTVVVGKNAQFTVKATGNSLKYQWEWRAGPNAAWANASAAGNKTATLTVPGTTARHGFQYRCKITDAIGRIVYTKAVVLNVLGITAQPTNKSGVNGATTQFNVKATGVGLQYQWQYRTSATGMWMNAIAPGNKTATLNVPLTLSKNGYQYRCKLTDGAGNVIYTNVVNLKVTK